MAGYRGDYDPTGFDPGDPSTWPGWTGTDAVYEAGDWWYVAVAATLPAQAHIPATDLDVGDRLYPVGFGRLIGEGTFGSGVFGGPLQSPWRLSQGATVLFRPWSGALSPWDRPPPPYAGCPFDDRLPGWRIVFEVLYADAGTARRFGQDTFGSGVFGSGTGRSWETWHDHTAPNAAYRVRHGNEDGTPVVEASELDVEVLDPAGDVWPLTIPNRWDRPGVGNLCRLSLLDPFGASPLPLFVGRIESVVDAHDRPPRTLALTAFGLTMDLVTTVPRYWRPAEATSARVASVLNVAGWSWADPTIEHDPALTAHAAPSDPLIEANTRELLDLYALSGAMFADLDRYGAPRLRRWPLAGDPTLPAVLASDCPRRGDGYLATDEADVVADLAECLNAADVARWDADDTTGVAESVDAASVARFGRRSQALGFPLAELTATDGTLAILADAAVDRYGRTVNRVRSIEVAIDRDLAWFDVLATLDTGRTVIWERRALPDRVTVATVVVGVEHRMTPGHWNATVYLSTVTPTI